MRLRSQSVDSSLPAGTVTFLFTDIEKSTQLLRQLQEEQYKLLQDRHQDILQRNVLDNRGALVDAEGDGLFFVFPSARSALAACVAGQAALAAERWPNGVSVTVRMGLHTGEASPRNGKYVALAVNQAARVKAEAQGGQILASQATAVAAAEALPASTSLKDLGQFTLKDFAVPVQLFQVCHPSLRVDFEVGPVSSADAEPKTDGRQESPAAKKASPEVVTSYRSARTALGAFRVPGDIHVHIDGGSNTAAIFETLVDLEGASEDGPARFPMKFNRILRYSGGPQREDRAFAQTYRYHTPGTGPREVFDTFTTMRLTNGSDLEVDGVDSLTRILVAMTDWSGAVVELERVIGVLQPGGTWQEASPVRIPDPDALRSGPLQDFHRLATSPIEIHHSIDFPKSEDPADGSALLTVDRLPTWPNLGGWFLFDKGESWSYRSSEFVDRSGEYRYAASVGQKRLLHFLMDLGYSYELHTLVEQVLGIWRGGRQPSDDRSSVPALGEWEMSCPPNGHFWVIAANFFGDRNPDVRRAMVTNLSQDVTYTYFLNTYADVLRLNRLARDLESDLIARGKTADSARRSVGARVRCVLLTPELSVDDRLKRLLVDDYFLCPSHAAMGGYRLDSSGFSGERIDEDEYEYLVEALSPLLDAKIRGLFSSSDESWASKSTHKAFVCTDLEETGVDQEQGAWRSMIAAYDRIVARQVSTHGAGCVVVRPVRNGYLLVFDEPKEAAEWARRLQFDVQWRNEAIALKGSGELPIPVHNIALGHGSVTRILRAHGHDYVGGSIDECIRLADALRGGKIAMSRIFADQYEANVGKRESAAGTNIVSEEGLGELRLLEWP